MKVGSDDRMAIWSMTEKLINIWVSSDKAGSGGQAFSHILMGHKPEVRHHPLMKPIDFWSYSKWGFGHLDFGHLLLILFT